MGKHERITASMCWKPAYLYNSQILCDPLLDYMNDPTLWYIPKENEMRGDGTLELKDGTPVKTKLDRYKYDLEQVHDRIDELNTRRSHIRNLIKACDGDPAFLALVELG